MNKRLKEIMERKAELRAKLASGEELDLKAINDEITNLETEERNIRERAELEKRLAGGEVIPDVRTHNKPEEKTQARRDITDSEEYRQAFMDCVQRNIPMPAEFRDNQTTLQTDVSALIPTQTLNKIIEKLEEEPVLLPLVTRSNYKTGVAIPKMEAKLKATWVGENKGSTRQKLPLAGTITFDAYKLRCEVSVSLEVAVRTWSAFESNLVNKIAKAMAEAIEEGIISGDGSNKMTGILKDTAAGQKVEVKKAEGLTFKTIVKAEGMVPVEYDGSARWFMSKKSFFQLMGEVDNNGKPIALITTNASQKPSYSLWGRDVILTSEVSTATAESKDNDVIAFVFNPADYLLNTTFQLGVKVYEDNETDEIVRKSIMLVDGKPLTTESLVKIVIKG